MSIGIEIADWDRAKWREVIFSLFFHSPPTPNRKKAGKFQFSIPLECAQVSVPSTIIITSPPEYRTLDTFHSFEVPSILLPESLFQLHKRLENSLRKMRERIGNWHLMEIFCFPFSVFTTAFQKNKNGKMKFQDLFSLQKETEKREKKNFKRMKDEMATFHRTSKAKEWKREENCKSLKNFPLSKMVIYIIIEEERRRKFSFL